MGMDYGVLKMICERDSRKVLGVHIIGEGASELIHIGQAVINLGGTVDYFVENAFNYPTLAEAYKVAALDAFNRMPPIVLNPPPGAAAGRQQQHSRAPTPGSPSRCSSPRGRA